MNTLEKNIIAVVFKCMYTIAINSIPWYLPRENTWTNEQGSMWEGVHWRMSCNNQITKFKRHRCLTELW